MATFVEAPLEMQKKITLPDDHVALCKAQAIPMSGNAAGNTEDLLDLRGATRSPDPLPTGFTPRGIVALVFSILSAFLGMGAIVWYGLAEVHGS